MLVFFSPGFRVAACAGSVVFVSSSLALLARGRRARQGEFSFVVSGSATACWSGVVFFVFFLWALHEHQAWSLDEQPRARQVFCGRSIRSTYSAGRSSSGKAQSGDVEPA